VTKARPLARGQDDGFHGNSLARQLRQTFGSFISSLPAVQGLLAPPQTR
jgi:hypothetical protein